MSFDRNGKIAAAPTGAAPFHAGERALQASLGLAARMDEIGRKVIRPFMPDEHRALFAKLPLLFVGSLDRQGRPWASVLAGAPGFVASPDARTLAIAALPAAHDPLAAALVPGAPVGLLGLELSTRRRNRMNGRVRAADGGGFVVDVDQSFGNCPKYIQARAIVGRRGGTAAPAASPEGPRLSAGAAAIIAAADTCFIATAAGEAADGRAAGADVSHRGGAPGFVHMAEAAGRTVLTLPDYRGNAFFNTLGNVLVNPRAALLFVDFASGATLAVTGAAEIVHDGPAVDASPGAERLLRLRVDEGVLAEGAIGFAWSAPEPSPWLSGYDAG